MASALDVLLRVPRVQSAARATADWVDLQWSSLIHQLRQIAPRTRGRLLDVGCGEKPYESIFRPYVNEYIGVELQETFSATHASTRSSKPDVFYDGKLLPFESQTFDTVISVQVLEHTPHPQDLVNEMARVVKSGGLVIVSAPFSFRLHEEPHDYFRYTPHGLRALFEAAGLVVEDIWSERDLWGVVGHKINSFLAFRVARIQSVAQSIGKHGPEDAPSAPVRLWTLPFILPTMGAVSAASRILDRIAPDGSEALSYVIFGRPRSRGAAATFGEPSASATAAAPGA
jgi:SAM-dependent methyltransferase